MRRGLERWVGFFSLIPLVWLWKKPSWIRIYPRRKNFLSLLFCWLSAESDPLLELIDHAQCSCFRSPSLVWGCLSNVISCRSRTAALDCIGWSIGDLRHGLQWMPLKFYGSSLSTPMLLVWSTGILADWHWMVLGEQPWSCRFLRVKSFHDQQPSQPPGCPGTQPNPTSDAEKLEHLYECFWQQQDTEWSNKTLRKTSSTENPLKKFGSVGSSRIFPFRILPPIWSCPFGTNIIWDSFEILKHYSGLSPREWVA